MNSIHRGPKREFWDRVLSLVSVVEPGEGKGALLLAVNLFLLLAAYYILKTVREALILTEGGAEIKSYSSALQALLLLLLLPAYGWVASKIKCLQLITWVNCFFISHLGIFSLLGGVIGLPVGVPFFLWVGIFSVFLVAQLWACVNDMYDEGQGKRLFAIVGLGGSLGAWMGGRIAAFLFPIAGPYQMMLVAAGLLGVCIHACHRGIHCAAAGEASSTEHPMQKPLGKDGAFHLILTNRYLLLIALLILLVNIVNTTGEFLLSKVVVIEADRLFGSGVETMALKQAFIGKFYGDFFGWVNLLALLFQLFLVSRLLRYIGVACALLILPLMAMGGYALLVALPVLSVIQVAKVLEDSTDYSIQNTARQALFLRTTREAKYKAKAAIDTFFWRVGDLLQAAIVFVGSHLAFDVPQYALVNVAFVFLWLIVVQLIYYEHKKATTAIPHLGIASAAEGL